MDTWNALPVVPARGGAEVALDLTIRPFSSIELACAVRQPGPSVRALCELSENRTCARPHCNATRCEHFLHTSHGTLHTLHFTLHTCTSQSTLHLISNHFIYVHLMSPHLSSSHLIPSLLTCHLSKFFSTVFISSEHWKKFISNHLRSSARKNVLTVRAQSFEQKTWSAQSFSTQKLETQMHLPGKVLTTYFVLQSLHKALPSPILNYKTCTKNLPILLCTTKLAQSTSQYYFVLQSLRKILSIW